MSADWYVRIGDQDYGPATAAQLKEWASQGRISPESWVRRGESGAWVAATQVKGLLEPVLPRAIPVVAEQTPSTPPRPIPVGNSVSQTTPDPGTPFIDVSSTPSHHSYSGSGSSHTRRHRKLDQTVNLSLGIAGSVVLFVGFFCPVISIPIVGGMNYLTVLEKQFENETFNELGASAALIIVASLASLILAIQKQFPWLWATGVGAALAVLITFAKFVSIKRELNKSMDAELDGNPFEGIARMATEAVRLDFGLAIVLVGAGLLVAAAVVPGKPVR